MVGRTLNEAVFDGVMLYPSRKLRKTDARFQPIMP